MSKNSRPQLPTRGKKSTESERKHQHKYSDIKDAVELSIAASEALTISEIVKDGSASLPAAAVVEVALRVKQVRNQLCSDGLDSVSDCVTVAVDETDFLSDLDEGIMADAFEDVGLCLTQVDTICCSSSVKKHECTSSKNFSCVRETPLSESRYGYDGEGHVELRPQKINFDSSSHQKFEDAFARGSKLSKDSFGYVQQKQLYSEPPLALKPHFHQPVHNNSNTLGEVQDVKAFVVLNLKTTKSVPNFFHGETSFFSESANVAPDEISFAPKPGLESQIASFASVAFEGICGTANETILASQDMCSSASLVDPLCSIVPCSISPDNTDVTTTNLKRIEDEAGKDLNRQLGLENSQSRRLSFELSHGRGDVEFKLNDEGSGAIICRRKLTSLKSYSMLLPSRDAISKRSDYCNVSMPIADTLDLLSSEEIIDCIKSSNGRESNEFRFSMAKSKFHVGKNYEKDHERPAIPNSILASPDQQKGVVGVAHEDQGPSKKRVRFSEAELKFQQSKVGQKLQSSHHMRSISGTGKRSKELSLESDLRCQEANTCLTTWQIKDENRMIFQGLEFLLTGFTSEKETELGALIRKHGGFVLSDVPSLIRGMRRSRCTHQQLPVLLSPKKLQTTKFLYGCAVSALLLKVTWLTDSILAGSVLPPQKYMIISNRDGTKCSRIRWPVCCDNKMWIFDEVGIMLHGKPSFCTKLAKVVKHGGGQVFKTLQSMVQGLKNGKISLGAIVVEDNGRASRHLRHCAYEQRLHVMPASWIVSSLHLGHLLPFKEKQHSFPSPRIKIPQLYTATELSQEI